MIKELLEKCEKKENFFSSKGDVDPRIVENIESSLKVSLDEDYRYFLETYGFAIWFGHRICGVSELNECSTEHYTNIARSGSIEKSVESVVLMPYEAGGYYMLVCEGSGKGKVVLVETRHKKVVEEFVSFTGFVRYLLKVSPN